ncbi:MAG TPA: hypothetical protein VJZ27_03125, partial [Aggregatilineales bacterium]|nr:hypothetical protein [Aggregatilineales bacterium]
MPKKRILLMMVIVLVTFTTAGCIDLFYIPGIGVSPDGSQLYFLQPFDLTGESSSNEVQFASAPFNGTSTPIMEAFGAFTVNPASGAVVFSSGLQEGEIDQTFLMKYEDGEARLFVGPEAFAGNNFLATQLKYSRDGSRLAMTGILAPPEADLDVLGDSESFDPTQLGLFDSVVYLVDVNSGALTLVSDPEAAWANTLDWSPDGRYIAYNGWLDSNADGLISTGGGFASMAGGNTGGVSDGSQIHIYDTSSGETTNIDGAGTAYAPTWVSNNQLAYVEVDSS